VVSSGGKGAALGNEHGSGTANEGRYRDAGRVLAGSGGVGSGWIAIGLVFPFLSFFLFLQSLFPKFYRHF
jgi:hypothetical protein